MWEGLVVQEKERWSLEPCAWFSERGPARGTFDGQEPLLPAGPGTSQPRHPGPGPLQVLSEGLPWPAGLGGGPFPGDGHLQAKAFLRMGFRVGKGWVPTCSSPPLTETLEKCLSLWEDSVSSNRDRKSVV